MEHGCKQRRSSHHTLLAACAQEHEILAVIDRSDEAVTDPSYFSPQDFYALADETGKVHIRWIDVRTAPPCFACLCAKVKQPE